MPAVTTALHRCALVAVRRRQTRPLGQLEEAVRTPDARDQTAGLQREGMTLRNPVAVRVDVRTLDLAKERLDGHVLYVIGVIGLILRDAVDELHRRLPDQQQ